MLIMYCISPQLKVSQPDGLPVLPSNQKVKVSINLVLGVSKVSPIHNQLTRFPTDPTETRTLPEAEFDLPANGLVEIPLDAPANTRSATIRVILDLQWPWLPCVGFVLVLM